MIDYMLLELFSELHTQAETLLKMATSNSAAIRPDCDLPDAYMHAILRFRYFLNEAAMFVSQYGINSSLASPPLRDHFYNAGRDHERGCTGILRRMPSKLDEAHFRLCSYLQRFRTFKDRRSANHKATDATMVELKFFGMTMMVDELQRLIESEPKAKSLITPFIASTISDLAIVSECLHQLEIYQPWARTFDTMLTDDRRKLFDSEYDARDTAIQARITRALESCGEVLGRLGAPTGGRFSYPIEKHRNEAKVTILRKAESHLDAFWSKVNKYLDRGGTRFYRDNGYPALSDAIALSAADASLS